MLKFSASRKNRIVHVVLAQGPCKMSFKPTSTLLELCESSLCRGHAISVAQRKKNDFASRIVLVSLVQGPRYSSLYPSVEKELDCTARLLCEIRTFGRAVVSSNVSPLTNRMGASLAEGAAVTHQEQPQLLHSSVPAHARLLAFVFATGTCCTPFFMRKTYANDGSSTVRRRRSATASSLRARRSTSPASVPRASMLLSREVLAGLGRAS